MKTGTFRHYDKDLGHAKGNQLRATIPAGYVPPIFSKCTHKVKAVQAQVREALRDFWIHRSGNALNL